MTINEERESFSAVLHDAALHFDLPRSGDLYDAAVRRGRRIKRRRALRMGTASGFALAAAGVLVAVLATPGTTPSRPDVTVTGAATTHLGKYMAENLKALLPSGTKLQLGTGALPLSGTGYDILSSSGIWEADASASIVYEGRKYSVELQVIQQRTNWDCSSFFIHGSCTTKQVGGGTFIVASSTQQGGPKTYFYFWNLAGGKEIEFQVNPNLNTKNPTNPFTERQMRDLLTAPAWTRVLDGLPAVVDCPDLEPFSNGPHNSAPAWRCTTTGKIYPQQADVYAASS
jgi:hypothetical protein